MLIIFVCFVNDMKFEFEMVTSHAQSFIDPITNDMEDRLNMTVVIYSEINCFPLYLSNCMRHLIEGYNSLLSIPLSLPVVLLFLVATYPVAMSIV